VAKKERNLCGPCAVYLISKITYVLSGGTETMRVRLTRRPGQSGTAAYVAEYGDRLICVRYRYDAQRRRRYKTVEIIVEERPWSPPLRPDTLVGVRLDYTEATLRRAIQAAGAVWRPKLKVWALTYAEAMRLGLRDHIVGAIADL
jgi:hypothetical protein